MMSSPRTSGCLSLVLAGLFLFLCLAQTASGMTYSWRRHPNKERLVFSFADAIPDVAVSRTGRRRITISLPATFWGREQRPAAVDLSVSRLIAEITTSDREITIDLDSPSFGFITVPDPDNRQIILDIFRDPLGAKWEPPRKAAPGQAPAQAAPKTPAPAPQTEQTLPRQKLAPQPDQTLPRQKPTPLPEVQPQPAIPQKAPPVVATIPATNATLETTDQPRPGALRLKVKFQTAEEAFAASPDGDSTGVRDLDPQDSPKDLQPSGDNGTVAPNTANTPSAVTQSDTPTAPASTTSAQAEEPKASRDKKPEPVEDGAEQTVTSSSPSAESEAANATSAPNFKDYIITAKATLQNGETDAALGVLQGMLKHPKFPDSLREETLYLIADALFQKFHNDLDTHFQEVMSAFQRAVTYDTESLRLPSALLSMGLINLKVGNLPEAKGYFKLIRSKYPNDSNVPLTYYYLGEHYLDARQYQKAADNFQFVIQNYPDNSMAQSCAVGLTRALKELGYYKQGFEIMDYVQKRWPRYYIKDPDFLMLAGYIDFKNDHLLKAKEKFWTYVNLTPEAENVDIALARIGDIYVMTDKKHAAREIYEKTAERFPDKEGGLIAKMRLAEEGVFDKPSIRTMFSVFDKPYSLRPKEVYTQIIEKYPQSPLAPVARLKLAMWQLWSDKFKDTLQTVADFVADYPAQELLPKALEVGNKAFSQWITKAIKRDRYQDIATTWEKYPFLHAAPDPMTRLAVATSLWKNGDGSKALELAAPFLSGNLPEGKSSGPALDLVLAILVQSQSWQQILDMTTEVKKWKLAPNRRRQFEYTQALAYENLGQEDKSYPLWTKLASEVELPDSQRAYALYFMAKHAERIKDLQNEYMLAQQALSLFLGMPKQDLPKIRDCLDMLIRVTSRTRRFQEALGWGLEFEKYMNEDDPSWPAHMYTLANLFKLNKDQDMWKKKLVAITTAYPDSIYSKMAARDLEAAKLQKKMQPFE